VHAERVRADVETDRGLELLLAREREGEHALGHLVVLDLVGVEVGPDGTGWVHTTDSVMDDLARS
jgi:hypothetical protein